MSSGGLLSPIADTVGSQLAYVKTGIAAVSHSILAHAMASYYQHCGRYYFELAIYK